MAVLLTAPAVPAGIADADAVPLCLWAKCPPFHVVYSASSGRARGAEGKIWSEGAVKSWRASKREREERERDWPVASFKKLHLSVIAPVYLQSLRSSAE